MLSFRFATGFVLYIRGDCGDEGGCRIVFHPQHEYKKELLKSAMIQDVE